MANFFDRFDNGPADDNEENLWLTKPSTPGNAQDTSTDDEMKAWGVTTPVAKTATAAAPSTPEKSFGQKAAELGMGALRGAKDVVDTGAHLLSGGVASGAEALANNGLLPQGLAQSIRASSDADIAGDAAGQAQFTQDYGDSNWAAGGRIGGQIAASAPLAALAGPVAAAGGRALEAGGVPFARAAGDLLAGTAGRGNPAGTVLPSGVIVPDAGSALVRTGARMANGALEGATVSGAVSSANPDQSLKDQLMTGGAIGALAGPIAPALVGAGRGAVRTLTRGMADQDAAQLARVAGDRYGINVEPGQLTSNRMLRFGDDMLSKFPGSGGTAARAEQQTAFNRAVANSFGEQADRVTPDVLARAQDRIGNVFDSVAARTQSIPGDRQFVSALGNTLSDANQTITGPEFQPLLRQAQQMGQMFQGGAITGDQYQALTRKGAPLDRLMQSSNPNVAHYAQQLRSSLDDLLQRQAPADVVQDLTTARQQWKALKTIQPLADKSPTGDISPANLLGQVRNAPGGVAQGNDLTDLGRIGQRFLKEPNSSGTAERLTMQNALGKLAGMAPGALGLSGVAGVGAAAGLPGAAATGAGLVAMPLIRRAANSQAVRSMMLRPGGDIAPGVNSLLNATGEAGRVAAPIVANSQAHHPLTIDITASPRLAPGTVDVRTGLVTPNPIPVQ